MRLRSCAILIIMSLGLHASAEDKVQLLEIVRVTNVDAGKKVLKVKDAVGDSKQNSPRDPFPIGDVGIGFPGGGGTRGRERPIGQPGGADHRIPEAVREHRVTILDSTVIKDGDLTIPLTTLQKGDRLKVLGVPKGDNGDLQATEITLLRNVNQGQ